MNRGGAFPVASPFARNRFMPAWPGGPCPQCGEEMPLNMISCRNCRCLLNQDLRRDSVEIPTFIPLPELEAVSDLQPTGYYVPCPACQRDLKIAKKYAGERVSCKHCSSVFRLDLTQPQFAEVDVFSLCPHCAQSLRFAKKYVGTKVACRFCNGKLKITAD